MARNPKSIGEMISTITFFGVAVACALQALSFYEKEFFIRSYVSMFACLLCILGGLRFVIANLFYNLSKRKRKWLPE